MASGFVGVDAVVADGLLSLWREVEKGGGDEVGGGEDFKVALGGVLAFGAVDDGLGRFVPGDFLEGKGMAEEIFGKAFAPAGFVGGHVNGNSPRVFTFRSLSLGIRVVVDDFIQCLRPF